MEIENDSHVDPPRPGSDPKGGFQVHVPAPLDADWAVGIVPDSHPQIIDAVQGENLKDILFPAFFVIINSARIQNFFNHRGVDGHHEIFPLLSLEILHGHDLKTLGIV